MKASRTADPGYVQLLLPKRREFRRTRRWRAAEFGLYKDFLDIVRSLIELLIQDIHFFYLDSVSEHLIDVDLILLNHLKKFLPVHMYRCLAVTDQADAALHQGSDVEVIRLGYVSEL